MNRTTSRCRWWLWLLLPAMASQLFAATETDKPLPLNRHLEDRYTDDLPALQKRHYIRILTTVNRTNFYIDDGQLAGFEYSLLQEYQKFLNKKPAKNALPVTLEFIPVSREELMPKLLQGYGDIAAAGLTITEDRRKKVDFTDPYLSDINEVVVSYHKVESPKALTDLAGLTFMVRKSSSYYQSLLQLNKSLTKQKLPPVHIIAADEDVETEQILELLNSGQIAFTVVDSHLADLWSQMLPNIRVHSDLQLRSSGKIAWMVRKSNPKLRESLNKFISTHKKGTLMGNIYFKRYYENRPAVEEAGDVETGDKIAKYSALIKKYAAKYDMDWLLILAQANQESGLDHAKKSPVGAVGLLQLLPSTAADKRIAIPNIEKLENNIHAGVKYMAMLRDDYFNDPKIRPRDKIRFALAAYNAGPAKVARLRKQTEKMGLDSNKWFRNVEFAALKHIGRETVNYVSNINRHYVLYRTLYAE